MNTVSSLSGRKDTAAPILTPAVGVQEEGFVTKRVTSYASLLQVHTAKANGTV